MPPDDAERLPGHIPLGIAGTYVGVIDSTLRGWKAPYRDQRTDEGYPIPLVCEVLARHGKPMEGGPERMARMLAGRLPPDDPLWLTMRVAMDRLGDLLDPSKLRPLRRIPPVATPDRRWRVYLVCGRCHHDALNVATYRPYIRAEYDAFLARFREDRAHGLRISRDECGSRRNTVVACDPEGNDIARSDRKQVWLADKDIRRNPRRIQPPGRAARYGPIGPRSS